MLARMNGRKPANQPEVYAREQIALHSEPIRELKLQAIRIGDLTIATLPNEVYALTGLKLKGRSPSKSHFNVELANGSIGYIPNKSAYPEGNYEVESARVASGSGELLLSTALRLLAALHAD